MFAPNCRHVSGRQVLASLTALLAAMGLLVSGRSRDSLEGSTQETALADAEIHAVPGVETPGEPTTADPNESGVLRLKIADASTGQPVPCRVHIVGSDGNSYEPAANPLSPYSLHRMGNRKEKGPFRYYGWFFYCRGGAEVRVPPGKVRVDVWRGLESTPVSREKNVLRGQVVEVDVSMNRAIDMAARGWFSGDTHIHHDRLKPADDERTLDLAEAEDIRFMHILCMNDPRTYSPLMDKQLHPQSRGLGAESERRRGRYGIASGQEYRCGTYGHICFVGGKRLVDADGPETDPNQWPLFAKVAEEVRGMGGYSFHAHGGYEQEIYADFAQAATDGVELLQFAVYRGIGRDGWYHMLNAGFRFPAVGASDYPYCRALGDCRTYVRPAALEKGHDPTFAEWNKAAAEGRSFFTTGPLLELTVEGKSPGETIDVTAARTVPVFLEMSSPVAAVDELELIVGGVVRSRRKLEGRERRGPFEWKVDVPLREASWIAARAWATSRSGKEDVEAHTNPIYLTKAGRSMRRQESVDWLIGKLDQQIAVQQARNFAKKPEVLAWFRKSREILESRRE